MQEVEYIIIFNYWDWASGLIHSGKEEVIVDGTSDSNFGNFWSILFYTIEVCEHARTHTHTNATVTSRIKKWLNKNNWTKQIEFSINSGADVLAVLKGETIEHMSSWFHCVSNTMCPLENVFLGCRCGDSYLISASQIIIIYASWA